MFVCHHLDDVMSGANFLDMAVYVGPADVLTLRNKYLK
jgi:hypothetical protein